jgi:hypothetical protein
VPEDTARSLLQQGYGVKDVANRTGLPVKAVTRLAKASQHRAATAAPDGEQPRLDVTKLVTAVNDRLKDLGVSQLAASKMGKLSRSTLATLGKGGKIPSDATLDKLDELLSWEPGSARRTLQGQRPIPRESPHPLLQRPAPPPDYHPGDYANLGREIEQRLRELNMSKTKFAAIGGPGRSTLATLGRRGYLPAHETLARIDKFLLWEPGSAETVLKGGLPIRRGPTPTPHPSLVPLSAVLDRQRRLLAQLTRWEQSIEQMKTEVAESINHVNVAIADLQDPRRRDAPTANGQPATNDASANGVAANTDAPQRD